MKLKVLLYSICFLIHSNIVSLVAQVSDKGVSSDSIIKILERSSKSFSTQTNEGKEKGVYFLELAEKLIKKVNDPLLEIEINRKKMEFFLGTRDTIRVEEYLAKNLKIIKQIDNKRQLGLYYEDLGVHKSMQGKNEEGYQAYLIAEQLLRKYGKTKDVIDINYNLSLRYIRRKRWNEAIEHALKSVNAIRKTGVKPDRRKNLNLFLAESHINLKEFEKAALYFDTIEREKSAYSGNLYFEGRLFSKKGLYYKEMEDYKNAALFYSQSFDNLLEYHSQRTREVSTALALSNQLDLKEEENKRIKLENDLKAEQLENRGYIILLSVIIILGLVLISIIQYRISLYKTRVNKLLQKNYKELVEANKKVDEALEAKSEFLDSVTHELLTPLNTIKGTTFLLQKEKLTSYQVDQMKLINLSSDYLLNLIADVIHLNELEKGKLELKNEKFDLKALLNNLIDSSVLMKNNNNKIHRKIDHNIPDYLKGDVLRVSQIFLNILDNALKFTINGDIYIETSLVSKTDNNVEIEFSIRDTGIGMSEMQISKAFEAFHQGSVKINRKYGGTGLGLSIVKEILKLQGSDIVLKSKPEEGTLVLFSMKFDIPEQRIEKNIFSGNGYDESREGINVLLVEDNKVNQLITEKIISNYGFHCDSANDGKEAVDMVKKNKYSMILMDIMMPKMDGFEATKYIKKFNRGIPIVALTAISEKLNRKKFNEVGIYTVLHKPVDPELLYETIMGHCDK
ncbi:signal transduction histidine kinase [Aquimarina sp. MAR_2010_214]|uniref:response regulator n=1 Tax=Aquimarina sp. MAR_2010_214 TaxID=1250026 RepID=UPI000C7024D2|nr:response regulator [Aquimarina sp. MAR_2010_214]PKV49336.1 signal transduction histidine kinase [Aquimarina sp. MAR_2010_214]